jgi:hypothetical protein
MALTGFTARNVLNNIGGSLPMPSGYNRWLALFTTAPGDNDTGAVEVTGGSYARAQVAGSLTTNASTPSGNNVLHFASVPLWITEGMQIQDVSTSGVITSLTVSGVTSTTVVMSGNVGGSGVGDGDTITFSAFGAATGQGPALATSIASATFQQATASWGVAVATGIYDAINGGNLLDWDWLGNDPWFPCSISLASPGIITAPGITAGSLPPLANGASVVFTARFGGTLPAAIASESPKTVAGLISDAFNVGINTATSGSGMVRQITQQSIGVGQTASFANGALTLDAA